MSCERCPDGHDNPKSKPWSAFVSIINPGAYIIVCPANGSHVAESDAEAIRELLRKNGW